MSIDEVVKPEILWDELCFISESFIETPYVYPPIPSLSAWLNQADNHFFVKCPPQLLWPLVTNYLLCISENADVDFFKGAYEHKLCYWSLAWKPGLLLPVQLSHSLFVFVEEYVNKQSCRFFIPYLKTSVLLKGAFISKVISAWQ